MLEFSHKIISGIRADITKMSTGDKLEWIVADPNGIKNATTNSIRFVTSGSIRLELNDEFSKTIVAGEQTDNYRPKENTGGFSANLRVTYTALEDSIYICALKTDNPSGVATRNIITVDESGTVQVPAQTLVIPTAVSTIDDITLQVGDVHFTENDTVLSTTPQSIVSLTQFN